MDESIRSILENEIKMTMGCTDPGAIAFASSQAAAILDGDLKSIDIVLSKNIYKNAVYVGIPVIKKFGIEYAAILGAIIKKPELKLAVLGEVTQEMQNEVSDYLDRIPVKVVYSDIDEPLYISVTCRSDISYVNVVIMGDYDWIYHIEKNKEILYHSKPKKINERYFYEGWNFQNLFYNAVNGQIMDDKILKYEDINKKAATHAMSEETKKYIQNLAQLDYISVNDLSNLARIYVLNASKMRMSGERFQIVSVAGSGNLGILSILTVSAVCDALKKTQHERQTAICISILTSIYIKSQMNRLTVMCGTAVAGAAGAAAAITYLLGGGLEEAENAINTVIGSIGGMLCDGAKESCAFKVSFAAECAVISANMAMNKNGIRTGCGIITDDIDENIRNIGLINNLGMKEADNIMLEILSAQKK
ncbi:serine dehydratase subunit alpha family protein [Ruminiclostridium herbifermentans]|uniref:Serine dehydratase subunit alpha family protein n=1 Tax=Ruminiclostridium herbifermentans TaxID=2488810 RepID=A0A7H1VTE7_9FIRM|nr:L-serine ammonia-lyase, iron-sulfur-dependent, subunit alpha [Ruminiclostridium herbifermentans]QNU68659.1 serine dehydratase subunit alpha family protein [Ruminiclostridium herbifermentans]